ncbi:MAG: hypothetical protein K8L99_12815 [Anaerolineae bacterium]|nr:hypothetical protein [Anaerolineae bacterium]
MTKGIQFACVLLAGLLTLAACAPAAPVRSFTVGDPIETYDFSEGTRFEEGLYGNAFLQVIDDVYRIRLTRGDNELWWGQGGDTLDNVVIDVTVEQISERNENAFGIGCRMSGAVGQTTAADSELAAMVAGNDAEATAEATIEATEESTPEATTEATAEVTEEATAEATVEAEATTEATAEATEAFEEGAVSVAPLEPQEIADGSGYLFLIQGTGSYAIMRASGRDVQPLVNWTASSAIHQGQATNELRAVCVDDYLAFYINGQFVADATDDAFSAGQVALMASAATRLGVTVEFDNLIVSEVSEG